MPKLDPVEHKRRKEASALRCLDESGKPLNAESVSVAVQDKKDTCDINRIVKKVLRPDGQIDLMAVSGLARPEGIYGDFTSGLDFQEIQNRLIKMNNWFESLDPVIRARFDNDPGKLIDYLKRAETDSKVKDEAIEMGILPKPVVLHKRLDTPEGSFWVTTKDDVEIARNPIKTTAAAPAA